MCSPAMLCDMVQSITTENLTQLNPVMHGLIKRLFPSNCPIAQLSEYKTKNLRRASWYGFESKSSVLIFTKRIDVTISPGVRCYNTRQLFRNGMCCWNKIRNGMTVPWSNQWFFISGQTIFINGETIGGIVLPNETARIPYVQY